MNNYTALKRLSLKEKQQLKREEHAKKKAAPAVYSMYELAIILEGIALDEEQFTIHGLAVKLRQFLSGINDIEVVGENSDILEKMLLKIAPKIKLIPILCDVIWSESRKFIQVFRQMDPLFIFGQEDTVKSLFLWIQLVELDTVKYNEVSKLLNELKKL
jgi:hypothetical protein